MSLCDTCDVDPWAVFADAFQLMIAPTSLSKHCRRSVMAACIQLLHLVLLLLLQVNCIPAPCSQRQLATCPATTHIG